jgi:HK97 family phage portal protein
MAFWNRKPAWDFTDNQTETRALPTSGLATPAGWMQETLHAYPSATGKRVTVDKALGLSPVWSAVSLISEQVGLLPLKVYRRFDDAEGESERVEARQHRMWTRLHDRPNSHTPADRFWAAVTSQLLLYGNAFIEKRRDYLGQVDEFFLLDPERMTVKYDPRTADKRFLYMPIRMGEQPREFTTDEVLHIWGLSADGIVGLSVVQYQRSALGAALARDEFEGTFYRQGANLSGVLKHPDKLSQDAVGHLKESFKALYGGSLNAHGVPVLEEGMEFVTVGSPMRDLEFVAAQNMTRSDVAVMFHLPPNVLGGSSGESLTYTTVESNGIHLAMYAIAPVAGAIAKALSNDSGILPQNVFEAEFELKALMRADATTRSQFYTAMKALGAMTADEIRREENLPALTDAQKRELAPPPAPKQPLQLPDSTGSQDAANGAIPIRAVQ